MGSPACSLKLPDVIDEFEYFQDGDLIIGGVLTLRSKIEYLGLPEEKTYSVQTGLIRSPSSTKLQEAVKHYAFPHLRMCSSVGYYMNLLAFLYAIDNINQDPDILPNITLGFHLYDSWLEPKKGVQSVLQILSGPNGTVPNYSCKGQGKLAGVIGDQYSSTTIPIAQILGLYRYTQLHKYVKQIKNPFKIADRMTFFDDNGEFPSQYTIANWMCALGSKPPKSYVDVGSYTPWAKEEDQIYIDPNKIIWNKGNNKKLESRCADTCLPGSRKKQGSSIHSCCYECVPCSEGQISRTTESLTTDVHCVCIFLPADSENCMKCPDDEWPNEKKDQCVPRVVEFLSYTDDPIVGVFSAVSILCCLLTGLILRIFIHYQDTPIVKANNRDLSYLLLVSIMLSFLCVFLFLGHPVDVTCMLRVTSFGVIFSVAVSSLLAKSIMVCIAFKATKPGSHWRKWMGAKLPNFIICVFSLVQVIICVTWLSISPPFQDRDTHSYEGKMIVQCNEGSVIGFYSVLGYLGLLAAVSFIIAFLARTLPDSFNEAKYITFSMLVFCSVWIAMIPAYLSTRGKYMVAVEVFAIIASSIGLLGCIFFPKCYIILFRPDLNTKTYIH
ncbi:vomeronasal type-2 receptor 26-like [Rana temporaria]|uniref:vomeronasal type-2 receptor 26-like n=1 Tax=Rana temporaria TaxID=8407 RepID=UPI001AAD9DE8|nr:vomeronasal type-2 receptor 26-like [Rana temporaria]